jgi:hypothetical protein
MELFTFIMDFSGGTYVSQVRSESVKTALSAWAKQLNPKDIYGMGVKMISLLQKEIDQETPVPLTGLSNAWFASVLIHGRSVFIHIVATNG